MSGTTTGPLAYLIIPSGEATRFAGAVLVEGTTTPAPVTIDGFLAVDYSSSQQVGTASQFLNTDVSLNSGTISLGSSNALILSDFKSSLTIDSASAFTVTGTSAIEGLNTGAQGSGVDDQATTTIASSATLTLIGPLQIGGAFLNEGTVELSALNVGQSSVLNPAPGDVVLDSGASLSGNGVFVVGQVGYYDATLDDTQDNGSGHSAINGANIILAGGDLVLPFHAGGTIVPASLTADIRSGILIEGVSPAGTLGTATYTLSTHTITYIDGAGSAEVIQNVTLNNPDGTLSIGTGPGLDPTSVVISVGTIVPCFAVGTHILTTRGELPVENLECR